MSALRSFRARFLVGTLLWTLGLLAVVHAASILMIRHFRSQVFRFSPIWIVIALALMVAGLTQVRRGLSLFGQLRKALNAVRDGRAPRVEGSYPAEVEPLVDDLNALLEHREEVVRRALAKAGDLAHGLKTPLAVLAHEADRAEESGNHELAAAVRQQVDRMKRQVEVHLAQARAAGSGAAPGARTELLPAVEGLVRTLQQLHADKRLDIRVDVAADHAFRGEREDLEEMLGNLLDNACKWAKSRIDIRLAQHEGRIAITIDDDGAGIDPSMRSQVMARGVRADEAAPGSGLGLAIVGELAELYGGSVALETSPAGGLRVTLELPAAT